MQNSRLRLLVALPYLVPHELCHWLAARLLGLRATIHIDHVLVYHQKYDWRAVVVYLAPSIFGLMLSAIVLIVLTPRVGWLAWALVIVCNILWQGACLFDFIECARILRHARITHDKHK